MEGQQLSNLSTQTQQDLQDREKIQTHTTNDESINSPSRLLNIPFDIRRQILKYVLPCTSIDARYGPVWHYGCTSLLHTSHQLRKESTTMIYSSNTFVFRISPHAPLRFLARTAPSFSSRMKRNDPIRNLFVNTEPEIHLIHKMQIEIRDSDCCVRIGDSWKKTQEDNGAPENLGLLLEEKARNMMELIPQRAGFVKKAKVVWLGKKSTFGWNERNAILQPLRDVGVQIEEQILPKMKTPRH